MFQKKALGQILAVIIVLAVISFLVSPYFQLRQVNIQGLTILKEEEIMEILKPYLLENIFAIDSAEIKARLLLNAYIKEVEVNKKLPAELLVQIEERIPVAKINNNGQYLFFTVDGFILEKGSFQGKTAVPEIKGFGYTFSHNRVGFTPSLKLIVQALGKMDKLNRGEIQEISYQEGKLFLILKPQIKVFLESTDEIEAKIKVLDSIIYKIKQDNLAVEYIDLSLVEKPVLKLKDKK